MIYVLHDQVMDDGVAFLFPVVLAWLVVEDDRTFYILYDLVSNGRNRVDEAKLHDYLPLADIRQPLCAVFFHTNSAVTSFGLHDTDANEFFTLSIRKLNVSGRNDCDPISKAHDVGERNIVMGDHLLR